MAQGEFTKQEAESTIEAVNEVMKAMPKSKIGAFLGHFNDIFLFLGAAKEAAPDESSKPSEATG
jgi:hypothetical protein